jgi:hydrogenase nickel incorporation protein HypB
MKINVLENILSVNEKIARENRELFDKKKIFVINLMASPGAGKTSFALMTIAGIKEKFKVAVIEGDVASQVDAEKIKAHGIPSVQINTGGACHLEANMIKNALVHIDLDNVDVLIIENVGNLVCPADFKLGEDLKVLILSIPEGDDKPLKYPLMFAEANVLILNKIDLLSLSDFDLRKVKKITLNLNTDLNIFEVSCKTNQGIDKWNNWLISRIDEDI